MAAEAAISTLLELLRDQLIKKVNFLRGVEGEVQSLINELTRMKSFLSYANRMQAQDERVRNWILEIKDVALDAEDAIEMFIHNLDNPRKSRGLLQSCVCFPIHVHQLHEVGQEIGTIQARLVKIDESRDRYGIPNMGELREPPERSEVEVRRRLDPWDRDEHLVGLEDEVKKLLEPTMDQEKKGLHVMAIVGTGGVGKSTLAREVYNHPNVVSGRFDCRAWVVVSTKFRPRETIKQLILETTRSEQVKHTLLKKMKNLEETATDELYLERTLRELLYESLKGKTYFIVLDDVWENEHWVSLKQAFPKEQDQTSRLLLTTRCILSDCQSLHELKHLDREKSWELFLKKGLTGNRNGEFPKELELLGRDAVEKCKGLPLAITVMGDLLAETSHGRNWEEALNELNSRLAIANNPISKIVEGILELSYQNLSNELKSFFLCLAFFREDATIPTKRLENTVVGQTMIQLTGRRTKEIARSCLDDLINRNMVMVKDLTLDNRVKSCHLHDHFRKICLKKAEVEIGLEIQKREGESPLCKPRHRVVQCDDLKLFPMNENKHIRSLFVLNVGQESVKIEPSYWKGFQHLKILDLDGYYRMQKLPHSFKSLLGLKRLRIGRQSSKTSHKPHYNDVKKKLYEPLKLPTWMGALQKLELLDMRTEVVKFPNVALEMDSMRHIHANRIFGPMSIGILKNIETLKYISLVDWMKSSSKLMDGCNIRALGLFVYDDESTSHDSSRVRASLQKLANLVKLYLAWNYHHPIDVAIIPPLINLTKLILRGKLAKCPSASTLPPNLSYLTLERSDLDEDPMEELSKLPKLSYLKLKLSSYKGSSMRLRDGFPSLRGLSLQSLHSLRSVKVKEDGMTQLKLIQVYDCQHLEYENLLNKSYELQFLGDTI